MPNIMLSVKNLNVRYGHLAVIRDLSIEIEEGKITAMVGANGAGKSSIINAVCGVLPNVDGMIEFHGSRIDGLKPEEIVGRGLVQVPEGRLLFGTLTVLENLELGAHLQKEKGYFKKRLEYVYSLFPRLEERSSQQAKTLSGGEQQMLAIGRGLMSRPKMLVLDEPSWGLAPKITNEVFDFVCMINKEEGLTVLLVEQHIQRCLCVADNGYVLENGEVTMKGSGAELLSNEHIRKAYLGM